MIASLNSISSYEEIRVDKNKSVLPTPSDEQEEVINYFSKGFNIKIEAVAGSGKTTTLLFLAREAKTRFNSKSLILTYNRGLKDEIKDKVKMLNLDKFCDVYTYHGYASKIYQTVIYNDKLLRNCLGRQPLVSTSHRIILMDEVQDMNQDYHRLANMIIKHEDLLVIVGDRRQCINDYLQASSKYLVDYKEHFSTGRPWKELLLRTSYRLTPFLANFVNTHILKENVILSGNSSSDNIKPIYHYGVWNIDYLIYLIGIVKNKYGPNEVVILVNSIKSASNPSTPIGKLLSRRHNNLLFSVRDDDTSDETTHNKIVVRSYNSMKGCERKCVVLTGFDESYFEYYDKIWPKSEQLLPNIIYVGATRARESLIIIQDDRKQPFRTIDKLKLPQDVYIKGKMDEVKAPQKQKEKSRSITDVTKHRNLTDILELLDLINIEFLNPFSDILPYQNIVQFDGYFEDMRRYYGILIPLYSEYRLYGKTHLPFLSSTGTKSFFDIYHRYDILLQTADKSIKQWMELVVMYSAITDGFHFYKDQIKNYDWVDEAFVIEASNRILDTIPHNGTFERTCPLPSNDTIIDRFNSRNLVGNIDYLTSSELWEFKCSSSISDDHKIQCAGYISLYYVETGNLLPCKLFNVRTKELMIVTITDPGSILSILARK